MVVGKSVAVRWCKRQTTSKLQCLVCHWGHEPEIMWRITSFNRPQVDLTQPEPLSQHVDETNLFLTRFRETNAREWSARQKQKVQSFLDQVTLVPCSFLLSFKTDRHQLQHNREIIKTNFYRQNPLGKRFKEHQSSIVAQVVALYKLTSVQLKPMARFNYLPTNLIF